MQATYKGQTAGGIIKTAVIQKMAAGTWEVIVTTKDGQTHVANIGERNSGWGGTVADMLVLAQVDGITARLQMSGVALGKMECLIAKCDSKYAH
jgi:hypothetical protein